MPYDKDLSALSPDALIMTDEEAKKRLPHYPLVQSAYDACRDAGLSPSEALQTTLEAWREFQSDGRPSGYGHDKRDAK